VFAKGNVEVNGRVVHLLLIISASGVDNKRWMM